MKVQLAYGSGLIEAELPDSTDVIQPRSVPGLKDEHAALLASLEKPIGCRPLREWLTPGAKVCIIFPDITRAMPSRRILPWLLAFLHQEGVQNEQIVLLNSTGTHRPNTPDELKAMLGEEICERYAVINHVCDCEEDLVQFGHTRSGARALINHRAANAQVRILMGFIEPHFFAGFSGGPKALMPGVAGLETVVSNHGAAHIGHPNATFGITEGNPLWEEMLDIAGRVGPSFLLNVTLNERHQITGWFVGDLAPAHRAGREFVRESAMQKVAAPYDVVVTTNSGYPLDINLYQGAKGMSAAARIAKPGGTIILAAECRDGAPAGSPFDRLLRSGHSPEELLARICSPGFEWPEQWQVQIQTIIQSRLRVLVHSNMPDDQMRAALLEPCPNISAAVKAIGDNLPGKARIAALPFGPLTIPYLSA